MTRVNSSPLILNGRLVANEVHKQIKDEIKQIVTEKKRLPGLAVILAGEDPASYIYVKNKEKTCIGLGLYSKVHRLPTSVDLPITTVFFPLRSIE